MVNASGNGAGKTYGMVAILGSFIWPQLRPSCFKEAKIFDYFTGPKRARIISTPKELEDIGSLQTTIQHLWPKGRYFPDKGGRSFYSRYLSDTGWTLDLMSYEQEVSEFAGPNLGLVCFNEPMPQPIWNETIARTRSGGLILAAMTSLRENPWVVDGLLSRANGEDIRVVYGDIEDNCKEHGKNGTLEHDQIERILLHYDPDEREARKTGKPLRFSGRIYKAFDRSVHVAREPIKAETQDVTHFMAVDPAIGKPFAAVWGFVDKFNVLNIYAEYPDYDFEGSKDTNLTLRDYASIFLRKEPRGVSITRILDRHFGNARRQPGGFTLKQELSELKLDFIDSYKGQESADNPEMESGIIKVKEFLRYNTKKPIDSVNRPRLNISPTCKNVIKGFERWTREPDTGKPVDEYKDHMDCIRYICGFNPEYERPRNWSPKHQPFYGVGT